MPHNIFKISASRFIFRQFIFSCLMLHLAQYVSGQLSLKNPQICHDKENFLSCYNDGKYVLHFSHGTFKEYFSADSSVHYSEADRTITFYPPSHTRAATADTVKITLLPKALLLRNGTSTLEITDLKNIPDNIGLFSVGVKSTDQNVDGISFQAGSESFEITIWTYYKDWSWDIKAWDGDQFFAILYNNFKKNRLGYIFIKDFSLKYGMAIRTTFKTLKRIDRLESAYVDTLTVNGHTSIQEYPLDKYYFYEYDKAGKLKTNSVVGELKLCECN